LRFATLFEAQRAIYGTSKYAAPSLTAVMQCRSCAHRNFVSLNYEKLT